MTRILLRGPKHPWDVLSAEETLQTRALAENAGNLLFAQSVYRTLSVPGAEITPDGYLSHRQGNRPEYASWVNAEFDHFVVALANAFRPAFQPHLRRLTKLINRLDIPVTVVGVGSQHKFDSDGQGADDLDKDVKDFMSAVLNHSSSVGVRGEYTADYLAQLGFGSEVVDVIGCPSLFMNGGSPAVTKKADSLGPESLVAMNVSPYVKHIKPILMRNMERYPNLIYVPQNHKDLNMMVWGENRGNPKDLRNPTHIAHQLYREDRMRFPLDPKTWVDYLSHFDFVFGTRIHGSVAGILAGVPTFLLAHDSRTLELAEYHRIPHAKVVDVDRNIDAAELFDQTDYSEFNATVPEVRARYLGFLEKNGLEHSFAPGQEPVEFDRKLAAAKLPPMVHTMFAEGEVGRNAVMSRLRYLHSRQVELETAVEQLATSAGRQISVGSKSNRGGTTASDLPGRVMNRLRRAFGRS